MTDKEKEALKKIQKLEELIAKKRALLIREKGKLSEKERKARNKKLIALGSLVETTGLYEADEKFILGVLLSGKDLPPESSRYSEFKEKGATLLKEKDKETK